jgi:geranylgeranyl diphosphate synthase, type I
VKRDERGVRAMVAAARDLTVRGGKRFRPALLLSVYRGLAPDAGLEPALRAGVALELLQSYLLIQDDWIDGDTTRRGGPSAHARLARELGGAHVGASSAILASDFTFGLALAEMLAIEVPPARRLRALEALVVTHRDVVIGQQMDVLGRAEDVERMHDLKTGSYTVRGPLAIGAALAGASPRAQAALARYAAPVGVAFQLRDDLLGAFAARAQTGKPEGGDFAAGKRTAVIVEAERRLDAPGRRALARVLGKPAGARPLAEARIALERCGVREAVERRLARLCERAESLAAALPLAPRARAELAGAARALRVGGAAQ